MKGSLAERSSISAILDHWGASTSVAWKGGNSFGDCPFTFVAVLLRAGRDGVVGKGLVGEASCLLPTGFLNVPPGFPS